MKYMIASDIHGSAYYCRKVLQALEEEGADRLILLGDLLYHGPRNDLPLEYAPKQVIPMLNGIKEKLLAVRGNCDTEVDQMVLEFPIMADYAVLEHKGKLIYCTHGHVYNEKNQPPLKQGDAILHGHTHVLQAKEVDGIKILNPGSTSIPKEGNPPTYAILQDGIFTIKTFDKEIIKEYQI
ncbi:MAG: phosphodiesterase [Ruminococcus sp.]|nr:phosphodiesterase [Ruminococcus sp.]